MSQGFRDPNGKYPLPRTLNQPQTPDLARGVSKNTIVTEKESKRTIGVTTALHGPIWNQPPSPFAAQYPWNHIMETESGHIQEFDDTPGHERIHTYHRTGTFEEIDSNGTLVRKIVGDNYVIVDRNGFVSIAGDVNVTATGNVNIMCQSDANIQVEGSAELVIGGNMDMRVARDMNIAVEGDFSLWTNGAMNLQSKGNAHIRSNSILFMAANDKMHLKSDSDILAYGKNMHLKADSVMNLSADGTMNLKSKNNVNIAAVGNTINMKAGSILLGNGFVEGKFKGTLKGTADYATTAGTAPDGPAVAVTVTPTKPSEAAAAEVAEKALVHGMVPAAVGSPIYPHIEPFHPPTIEESFMFETPQDSGLPINQVLMSRDTNLNGVTNTFSTDSAFGSGGGGSVAPSIIQSEVLTSDPSRFHANYRLSTHFTLGMMFWGGFNVKHKLVAQNGLTEQQIVANLAALCENILEPYLKVLPNGIDGLGKDWRLNSGYRMGSSLSDHCKGRAVDIGMDYGAGRRQRTFDIIQKLEKVVQYDQLILEYRGSSENWIHTGFRGDGKTTFGGGTNRLMAFTMVNDKVYSKPGFNLLG